MNAKQLGPLIDYLVKECGNKKDWTQCQTSCKKCNLNITQQLVFYGYYK